MTQCARTLAHPARLPMEGRVDSAAAAPLPLPPGRHAHETYIVQLPKDQVYRVPPRENALIVEQYRNPVTARNRHGGCSCFFWNRRTLLTFALILVAIVAVVGITLATLYFIFNPRGPTFMVSHVGVVKSGKSTRAQYEVSFWAKNPNEKLEIQYEEGDVSLLFRETKVAVGKFPTLVQRGDEASEVRVGLKGSSGALPRGMKGGSAPVDLKLEMNLGVRVTTVGFQTWVMRSNVLCDFKVRGIDQDTQVLSQACHAEFKIY